jgi:hypothetical protein
MYSMMDQLKETLNKGGSQEPMEKENKAPTDFKKNTPNPEEDKKTSENPAPTSEKEKEKNAPQDKKYNLEEVTEYTELLTKFTDLETKYSALEQEKTNLDNEVAALREFKLNAERQSKQQMIDSFYMLSDEDKKDVAEHIDTYSLDDIEAKLSILCVRNKVNFNLEEKHKEEDNTPKGLFNLNNPETDNVPDWVKAIRETAKSSI